MLRLRSLVAAFAVFAGFAQADVITKAPDLGAFWNPLDGENGTYIYANSFVATSDLPVVELGMWLQRLTAPGPEIAFEVYDSVGGDPLAGPDTQSVLATTGLLSLPVTSSLDFFSAPTLPGASTLVAGQTYWFGANVIGSTSPGAYLTGGHTRNSVIVDNGTFWYSNDPSGISFDGQGLTPEMAFQVTLAPVPEPGTLTLLGLGLAGAALRRRRRGSAAGA